MLIKNRQHAIIAWFRWGYENLLTPRCSVETLLGNIKQVPVGEIPFPRRDWLSPRFLSPSFQITWRIRHVLVHCAMLAGRSTRECLRGFLIGNKDRKLKWISYSTVYKILATQKKIQWLRWDSKPRPSGYMPTDLPSELQSHRWEQFVSESLWSATRICQKRHLFPRLNQEPSSTSTNICQKLHFKSSAIHGRWLKTLFSLIFVTNGVLNSQMQNISTGESEAFLFSRDYYY